MKANDVKQGETYMFVATDNPIRKHLEGQPFTVVSISSVWRKRFKQSRKVKRFFNDEGMGARADELEPMDGHKPGEIRCGHCPWFGMPSDLVIDDTCAPDLIYEVCPVCGKRPEPF